MTFDRAAGEERLRAIIRERSFSQGEAVKLASGRTSSFYFNMKPTMMHPEGASLIARLGLARIRDLAPEVDLVGGLEMGAVPIASAMAAMSFADGAPMATFFVRKAAKGHGTQSLVEGLAPGETLEGRTLAILEDVTTTGGSALQAVEQVRNAGAEVALVLTVVDRLEGAEHAFAEAGIAFAALLTADAFKG